MLFRYLCLLLIVFLGPVVLRALTLHQGLPFSPPVVTLLQYTITIFKAVGSRQLGIFSGSVFKIGNGAGGKEVFLLMWRVKKPKHAMIM